MEKFKDDEHNLNHNFYPIRTERAIAIYKAKFSKH